VFDVVIIDFYLLLVVEHAFSDDGYVVCLFLREQLRPKRIQIETLIQPSIPSL
jgi:hypothetical protein